MWNWRRMWNCMAFNSIDDPVALSAMFQRGNVRYYSNNPVSNNGVWQSISLIKYAMDDSAKHSLIKMTVSRGLLRSTVTNQVAFEHRDLHSIYEFEGTMDCRYQALVSKLETLSTINFT